MRAYWSLASRGLRLLIIPSIPANFCTHYHLPSHAHPTGTHTPFRSAGAVDFHLTRVRPTLPCRHYKAQPLTPNLFRSPVEEWRGIMPLSRRSTGLQRILGRLEALGKRGSTWLRTPLYRRLISYRMWINMDSLRSVPPLFSPPGVLSGISDIFPGGVYMRTNCIKI